MLDLERMRFFSSKLSTNARSLLRTSSLALLLLRR
jgi:hypothetical protein